MSRGALRVDRGCVSARERRERDLILLDALCRRSELNHLDPARHSALPKLELPRMARAAPLQTDDLAGVHNNFMDRAAVCRRCASLPHAAEVARSAVVGSVKGEGGFEEQQRGREQSAHPTYRALVINHELRPYANSQAAPLNTPPSACDDVGIVW